ncbi:hypothetical protein EAY46_15215 [Vibrio anguillarum]|uniref:Uncharacterized protein n=1 Tax=Vibrio anguillarum TaxID=55601 RepID=A0ABR9Z7I7_VIBAN|nr:hypothetical protein [Vibrio anguillarum]
MKTENKGRLIAISLSLIIMIFLALVVYLIDLPFKLLQWEAILIFALSNLGLCITLDLLISRMKRR